MSSSEPARPVARHVGSSVIAALAVACAVLGGVLGYQSLVGTSSSAASPTAAPSGVGSLVERLRGGSAHAGLGERDGVVRGRVTAFDNGVPAVARLDPHLRVALRTATRDAGRDGVEVVINSGWRSRAYQRQLLEQAVSTYGSKAAAARWVATPDASAHVTGDAVDVGPAAATAWLSGHGARYGLCQIYADERWHYELRPAAVDHGCPQMYADPTHDPRMHR